MHVCIHGREKVADLPEYSAVCTSVCMYVCVREGESERESKRERVHKRQEVCSTLALASAEQEKL